jgi:hypothetical protein
LGAGDGGFQVRNWDGALLASLRPMVTGDTDPSSAVVNAVTVDKDQAFLAAGSAGVLVVNLGRYRSDDIVGSDGGLLLQGTLGLEVGASCNMIKCRNDILVVAAGTGGVKLISMK